MAPFPVIFLAVRELRAEASEGSEVLHRSGVSTQREKLIWIGNNHHVSLGTLAIASWSSSAHRTQRSRSAGNRSPRYL